MSEDVSDAKSPAVVALRALVAAASAHGWAEIEEPFMRPNRHAPALMAATADLLDLLPRGPIVYRLDVGPLVLHVSERGIPEEVTPQGRRGILTCAAHLGAEDRLTGLLTRALQDALARFATELDDRPRAHVDGDPARVTRAVPSPRRDDGIAVDQDND